MLPAPPVMPGGALAAVDAGGLTFNPVPAPPGAAGPPSVALGVAAEHWAPSRPPQASAAGNGKLNPKFCMNEPKILASYVMPRTCLIAWCSVEWYPRNE